MKSIIATALRKLRAGGPQRPLEIGCGEFLALVGFDADALDPVRAEELTADYNDQPAIRQALVVLSESGNGGIVQLGCGDVLNALGSDADELYKTLKPMPASRVRDELDTFVSRVEAAYTPATQALLAAE